MAAVKNGLTTHSLVCPNYYSIFFPDLLNEGSGIHVEAFILSPMTYSVRIDDGPFVKQAGHGSFYSPSLPDGEHSIAYALPTSGQALPLFDYIAVTPGANTPLAGKVLAVDDTDPSISYAGNWGTFLPFNATANLFPPLYRGSAHWSSTIGDSLHFQFEGTSNYKDTILIDTESSVQDL